MHFKYISIDFKAGKKLNCKVSLWLQVYIIHAVLWMVCSLCFDFFHLLAWKLNLEEKKSVLFKQILS